jgi:TupA-like ATPgrasp
MAYLSKFKSYLKLVLDTIIIFIVNFYIYAFHPLFTLRYIRHFKRLPNFAAPSRLSELVQWRKLFDRNPLFPVFADKLRSKEWVRERCPNLAIPETIWVGHRPEDIPQTLIAPGYVIKTNHNTSQNHFPHRENWDRQAINNCFNCWLEESLADEEGEWAYEPIERRVFVERLVSSNGPIIDMTFRGHNGNISFVTIATGFKTPEARYSYYTPEGVRSEQNFEPNSLVVDFPLPPVFQEALAYAKTLSLGIDYVRVDFIWGGDRLYFSELTVYPASGYGIDDAISDKIFESWSRAISLSWFLKAQHLWPLSVYAGAFSRLIAFGLLGRGARRAAHGSAPELFKSEYLHR